MPGGVHALLLRGARGHLQEDSPLGAVPGHPGGGGGQSLLRVPGLHAVVAYALAGQVMCGAGCVGSAARCCVPVCNLSLWRPIPQQKRWCLSIRGAENCVYLNLAM